MQSALRLVGSGCGGVSEMQDLVDMSAVRWGLCCFDLGAGSFRRQKVLFLHLNGEQCPALTRGRVNGHTAEVQRLVRGNGDSFHASLEVTEMAEVSVENILARIRNTFVTDDDLGDYSMEAMLRDYQEQILSATARAPALKGGGDAAASQRADQDASAQEAPGKAATLEVVQAESVMTGREALRSVADPSGAWNWVLLGPDPKKLPLIAGGGGFLDEMRECMYAHQDTVLFGILRVVFGAGKVKRTKHVFVHVIGERTPAVRRGRLSAVRPQMRQVFAEFAECSLNIEVSNCVDFTQQLVIEKARSAGVVDDSLLSIHEEVSRCISSVEHALLRNDGQKECRKAARKSVTTVGPGEPRPEMVATPSNELHVQDRVVQDVEEVVRLVCAPGAPLNWALFGPTEQLLKTPSSSMSPVVSPFSSPFSSPAPTPRQPRLLIRPFSSPLSSPRLSSPAALTPRPDISIRTGKLPVSTPVTTPSRLLLLGSHQITQKHRENSGKHEAAKEAFTTPRSRRLSMTPRPPRLSGRGGA